MKKDAYYFPHYSNARNDRKVKRLRKELGMEGYGIYFAILEVLRDQTEFKYPIDDIDLLADDMNASEQKVSAVVGNYQLFEIDEDRNLFSPKFNFFLQPYLEKTERARQAARVRWDNSKKDANALQMHSKCKANDMQGKEIKGKERKGKEIKGDNNINTPDGLSDLLTSKLNEFIKYRKEIKKPIKTNRPIQAMINGIGKEFLSEDHLIQCIDVTMNNEWQGVKAEYVKQVNNKASPESEQERQSKKVGISGRGLKTFHETIEGPMREL